MRAEEIYKRHIKQLPPADRLRILALIGQDLAQQQEEPTGEQKQSVMKLHGLGKEIWDDVDAQEYVNKLREEWDQRS